MTAIVLAALVAIAATALVVRDLVIAVILMGVFSLFSALLFFLLHAPDVALTEAAVGAGVSTFLFVWVVRRTGRRDAS
ncbi:MAG TPA: hydrogenase subunit MbhD domain-containing protein [Desulfobacterales bacterium]|nr:hydrogenase subunit MbhD domain-containing protein [Desulfobacterales bacterium]